LQSQKLLRYSEGLRQKPGNVLLSVFTGIPQCVIFSLSIMHKSHAAIAIHENVPLAPYTTLGVGGPARFFTKTNTEDQISDALEYAQAGDFPVFILGGGSNIVVSDAGFSGMVIKIEVSGILPLGTEKEGRVSVGAGVEWDALVNYCVGQDLAGVECLSGIPGTVGGVPIQNVGAYGQEVGEVISSIRAWDRETGRLTELSAGDCNFAYRSSIFNTSRLDRYIILTINVALHPGGRPHLQYPDLQRHFAASDAIPTIRQVREAVLRIRESKSMVLSQEDPNSKSVGSFFRNPILNLPEVAELEEKLRTEGLLRSSEGIPRFCMPEGKLKLPAAWLIEHAGFHKGYVHGRAGISERHSLALINRGGATAQDIVARTDLCRIQVEASLEYGDSHHIL
jgi:UDP-N-acetylmuramate dehydrogenase